MVKYCVDNKDWKPELDETTGAARRRDLQAGDVPTWSTRTTPPRSTSTRNYITPKMLQFRLQKIMDEYVAGVATYYTTNDKMLAGGAKTSSRC
ncbi:MAG: hypothetical protein MZV65_12910 [Chromatiales bacterium]|nr:hypothetical protein [Chromatiales bacterium]